MTYWYATSNDKRNWTYSVNAQKGKNWWLLEIGKVASDVEIKDDPAFRMDGVLWEKIWSRLSEEIDSR